MNKWQSYRLRGAIALVALYVGAAGIAKLAGVEYVHSSFAALGFPAWFGYLIGVCEVAGPLGLLFRPTRDLAAAAIGALMAGATWYHAFYTPPVQAIPALLLVLLCIYIFVRARSDLRARGKAWPARAVLRR